MSLHKTFFSLVSILLELLARSFASKYFGLHNALCIRVAAIVKTGKTAVLPIFRGYRSKNTVGFLCQTIHKKFLRKFDTIFGLKLMMKSGLKNSLKFHDGLQSCCCPVQKICPERLNWPGRLAGISEGHRGISK